MALNKPAIVSGEASETDSDDEAVNAAAHSHPSLKTLPSIQGAVISGEDSESENDLGGSGISSAVSALSPTTPEENISNNIKSYDSLLHKKLRECNLKLHKDLSGLVQGAVDESGKNLSAIEQQLLKSQLTLQSAVTSLKSLNVNSTKIRNKLHAVISSVFIPNISVDK